MFETYFEQNIVRTEKNSNRKKIFTVKIFKIVAIIGAIIFAFLTFFSPMNVAEGETVPITQLLIYVATGLIPCIGMILLWFFLNRYGNSLAVEYDYVLSGQKFRIVKVINKSRRKKFLEISLTSIDTIGKITAEAYPRYLATPGVKKINALVNMDDDDAIYFAICESNKGKILLHFEPNVDMIRAIRTTVGRDIILKK